ncbi:hypothetical protein [Bacillus sp. E214]|uniref:hypothetical protein n=1 Tax=Bacillus sp. E214 TaxID=2587156 RepID=UPI0011E02B94|nr:hypothetical protein [Bacillus sp. E214]
MKKKIMLIGACVLGMSVFSISTSKSDLAELPTQYNVKPAQVAELPTQYNVKPTRVAELPTQYNVKPTRVAELPTQYNVKLSNGVNTIG